MSPRSPGSELEVSQNWQKPGRNHSVSILPEGPSPAHVRVHERLLCERKSGKGYLKTQASQGGRDREVFVL